MYFAQLTQGTRARETKPNVENMKTKKIRSYDPEPMRAHSPLRMAEICTSD